MGAVEPGHPGRTFVDRTPLENDAARCRFGQIADRNDQGIDRDGILLEDVIGEFRDPRGLDHVRQIGTRRQQR